jgi:O-antigen ligase
MRRATWLLLLLFVFTIPWEYSLDLGESLGNIARVLGVLVLLAAIPAVLQAGRLRTPDAILWATLALYLWVCCSYFWSIDPTATLMKMRGYFQEMMIVWLVWEFAETPADFRNLLRAYLAGSWVLAGLTLASFASAQAIAASQIRFVAEGQDPNDVARFLDLGLPMAALLLNDERRWLGRLLSLGFLPLGVVAVLLTASRGGFLAAVVALSGCCIVLARRFAREVFAAILVVPVIAAAFWIAVPHGTLERLATIPGQFQAGDLNQRLNIWNAGWQAFVQSPIVGTGAGTFPSAAGLSPMDTAHNTALSIVATTGLCGLFLAFGIIYIALLALLRTRGPLLMALSTAMVVWFMTSLVATVEENRTSWLLIGIVVLAGRLAEDEPKALATMFPDRDRDPSVLVNPSLSARAAG